MGWYGILGTSNLPSLTAGTSVLSVLLGRKDNVKYYKNKDKQYIGTFVLAAAKFPHSKLRTKLCFV